MDKAIDILHLEDDPADAELIQARIDEADLACGITRVGTRDEFLRALQHHRYDIILADYRLPKYDGISALRLVQERYPEVPFIFVSGTMGEEAAIEAMTRGATDYVLKQDLKRLGPAVKRALQEARNRRERKLAQEALQRSNEDLKQAEAALRASEARYIDLYENAPDMYLSVQTRTASIEKCNQTLVDALGYPQEEIIGRSVFDIYHPDCLDQARQALNEFLEVGEIHDRELQLRKKDGSKLYVSLNMSAVRAADGAIVAGRSALRDITERRRNSMINAARIHLMQFADTHALDELLEETVNEAENVTESLIGFYHFVDDDQQTLTLQNWSTRTKARFCKARGKGLHYPVADAGVWVDCVRERKPVVHNDYMSLAHRKGLPPGHAEVVRQLVLPVTRGEKIKAILGVGNKPADYSEKDVEAMAQLADLVWEITERKQAEQQVAQMSFALNGIHEVAFMLDENACFRYVNEEACRILGYSRDELLTMTMPDINPGFPMERWQGHWDELKERGVLIFEGEFKTRDGRLFPVEINANYFEYEGRSYDLGLARDISERRQAERERLAHLRFFENMERVNRTMQGADDLEAMMRDLLDVVLSIFDCDRAFLMYPCDPEAPTLYAPMERTKPEYPGIREFGGEMPMDPQVATALRVLLAADGPVTFGPGLQHALPEAVSEQYGIKSSISMAVYPKTGSPWQFGIQQCDSARIWTAEEMRMFDAIGRRLTDGLTSLLSYRDLRQSEEFLDNVVEHIPNMLFVKDARDLRFVRFNKAGEQLLGYSREELLGKTDYDFFPKKMADFFTAKDRQVIDAKELVDIPEETVRTRNNEQRLLHTKKIPILDETGAPQYLLGISEDFTERKKLEAQFRQVQKLEAIGLLAGGIAHDFNNILSAITGYAEISQFIVEPESQVAGYLAHILEAGGRAKDLINQIMMFSRETEQQLKPIRAALPVKEALKLIRASIPATIEMRSEILSQASVLADPTQVHQIVMNLCTNAAHAMKENGGLLQVRLTDITIGNEDHRQDYPDAGPGDHIRLTVSDQGHGIDALHLPRIFDPFFTTKEKGEGTGMGLSVVHGIVKSYGGFIYVHSRPGEGSTFDILIPALAMASAVPDKIALQKPVPAGCESILFVDDEEMIVDIAKDMLESLGYHVAARSSAVEALEAFRSNPDQYDLLVTDLTMPRMSGLELAEKILQIRPGLPIVLCTGFGVSMNEELTARRGVRNIIFKPILRRDLATAVRNALDSADG